MEAYPRPERFLLLPALGPELTRVGAPDIGASVKSEDVIDDQGSGRDEDWRFAAGPAADRKNGVA
jgi:hypothetical protein